MFLIGNAWRQTLSADAEMALPKKICSLNRRRTFWLSTPTTAPLVFLHGCRLAGGAPQV